VKCAAYALYCCRPTSRRGTTRGTSPFETGARARRDVLGNHRLVRVRGRRRRRKRHARRSVKSYLAARSRGPDALSRRSSLALSRSLARSLSLAKSCRRRRSHLVHRARCPSRRTNARRVAIPSVGTRVRSGRSAYSCTGAAPHCARTGFIATCSLRDESRACHRTPTDLPRTIAKTHVPHESDPQRDVTSTGAVPRAAETVVTSTVP